MPNQVNGVLLHTMSGTEHLGGRSLLLLTSEPWSSMQRSMKRTRPLLGVKREVFSKKGLTEPTLLEMSGYPTYQDLVSRTGGVHPLGANRET